MKDVKIIPILDRYKVILLDKNLEETCLFTFSLENIKINNVENGKSTIEIFGIKYENEEE